MTGEALASAMGTCFLALDEAGDRGLARVFAAYSLNLILKVFPVPWPRSTELSSRPFGLRPMALVSYRYSGTWLTWIVLTRELWNVRNDLLSRLSNSWQDRPQASVRSRSTVSFVTTSRRAPSMSVRSYSRTVRSIRPPQGPASPLRTHSLHSVC